MFIENDNGDEIEIPTRFELCPRCEGRGTHDHPAFDNGITADEWNGPDWDDESREYYMRGDYDVQCTQCSGLRVVEVPDVRRCTFAQKRLLVADRRARRELARDYASEHYLRLAEMGGC
jgi:hypothetical protein